MKIFNLQILILVTLFIINCKNDRQPKENGRIKIGINFNKYFDDCGVKGSTVIYDLKNNIYHTNDSSYAHDESLPASTFKIINLLIALETQVIDNENQIIKWPGETDTLKYGYRPDIYHDMSVKEAFEVSAGWVFIELAQKIGRDNYVKYLKKCAYGNKNLSEKEVDFWNFGELGISPINQVQIIAKLYENTLPFSKRNQEIVKRVMINEHTKDYTLRAKTGWTRDKGVNTGWWLGYIEKNQNVYFFATRILQDRHHNRPDFGSCRKEITKKILIDLKIL